MKNGIKNWKSLAAIAVATVFLLNEILPGIASAAELYREADSVSKYSLETLTEIEMNTEFYLEDYISGANGQVSDDSAAAGGAAPVNPAEDATMDTSGNGTSDDTGTTGTGAGITTEAAATEATTTEATTTETASTEAVTTENATTEAQSTNAAPAKSTQTKQNIGSESQKMDEESIMNPIGTEESDASGISKLNNGTGTLGKLSMDVDAFTGALLDNIGQGQTVSGTKPNEPDHGSTSATASGTTAGNAGGSTNGTTSGAANGPANGTTSGAANGSTDGTTSGTANHPADGTTSGKTDESTGSAPSGTTNGLSPEATTQSETATSRPEGTTTAIASTEEWNTSIDLSQTEEVLNRTAVFSPSIQLKNEVYVTNTKFTADWFNPSSLGINEFGFIWAYEQSNVTIHDRAGLLVCDSEKDADQFIGKIPFKGKKSIAVKAYVVYENQLISYTDVVVVNQDGKGNSEYDLSSLTPVDMNKPFYLEEYLNLAEQDSTALPVENNAKDTTVEGTTEKTTTAETTAQVPETTETAGTTEGKTTEAEDKTTASEEKTTENTAAATTATVIPDKEESGSKKEEKATDSKGSGASESASTQAATTEAKAGMKALDSEIPQTSMEEESTSESTAEPTTSVTGLKQINQDIAEYMEANSQAGVTPAATADGTVEPTVPALPDGMAVAPSVQMTSVRSKLTENVKSQVYNYSQLKVNEVGYIWAYDTEDVTIDTAEGIYSNPYGEGSEYTQAVDYGDHKTIAVKAYVVFENKLIACTEAVVLIRDYQIEKSPYDTASLVNYLDNMTKMMKTYQGMTQEEMAALDQEELANKTRAVWVDIQAEAFGNQMNLMGSIGMHYKLPIQGYGFLWSYTKPNPSFQDGGNDGHIDLSDQDASEFRHQLEVPANGNVYVSAYVVYQGNKYNMSKVMQANMDNEMVKGSAKKGRSMAETTTPGVRIYAKAFNDYVPGIQAFPVLPVYIPYTFPIDNKTFRLSNDEYRNMMEGSDYIYLSVRGYVVGLPDIYINGTKVGAIGDSVSGDYMDYMYVVKIPKYVLQAGLNNMTVIPKVVFNPWVAIFPPHCAFWIHFTVSQIGHIQILTNNGPMKYSMVTDTELKNFRTKDNKWSIFGADEFFVDYHIEAQTNNNLQPGQQMHLRNAVSLMYENNYSSNTRKNLASNDKTILDYTETYKNIGVLQNVDEGMFHNYTIITDDSYLIDSVATAEFFVLEGGQPVDYMINSSVMPYRWTNGNVKLSFNPKKVFSNKPATLEWYKDPQGNIYRDTYPHSITITENGTYYFEFKQYNLNRTYKIPIVVRNIDREPPKVSLRGGTTEQIAEGEPYPDMGVEVKDNASSPEACTITSTYEPNSFVESGPEPGNYIQTYHVKDEAGNETQVTRNLNVVSKAFTVNTNAVVSQADNRILNGSVSSTGGKTVTERGFVFGFYQYPTLENCDQIFRIETDSNAVKGNYSKQVGAGVMVEGINYNVRAYAIASDGTIVYGSNLLVPGLGVPEYGNFSIQSGGNISATSTQANFRITRSGGGVGRQTVYWREIPNSSLKKSGWQSGSVVFNSGEAGYKNITVSVATDSLDHTLADRNIGVEIYQVDGGATYSPEPASDMMAIRSPINLTYYTPQRVGLKSYFYYSKFALGGYGEGNGSFPFDLGTVTAGVDSPYYLCNNANRLYVENVGGHVDLRGTLGEYFYPRVLDGNDNAINYTGKGNEQHGWGDYDYSVDLPYRDRFFGRTEFTVKHIGQMTGAGENYITITNCYVKWFIDDKSAPRIISKNFNGTGGYKTGDNITIGIQFNESVRVDGTHPYITLNNNIKLDYNGGSGTSNLFFKGKIPEGLNASSISSINYSNWSSVKDYSNNNNIAQSDPNISFPTTIDSEAPKITLTNKTGTSAAKKHSVQVDVAGSAGNFEYVWSENKNIKTIGKGWKTYDGTSATLDRAEGQGYYYLHIRSKDTIGNIGYATSQGVLLDSVAPTINIAPNGSTWSSKTNVGLSFDNDITIDLDPANQSMKEQLVAQFRATTAKYYISDQKNVEINWSSQGTEIANAANTTITDISLLDTHKQQLYLYVWAKDAAGNESSTMSNLYQIDKIPPEFLPFETGGSTDAEGAESEDSTAIEASYTKNIVDSDGKQLILNAYGLSDKGSGVDKLAVSVKSDKGTATYPITLEQMDSKQYMGKFDLNKLDASKAHEITITYQAYDKVGNVSTRTDKVYYDVLVPEITITLDPTQDLNYWTNKPIMLHVKAEKHGFKPITMIKLPNGVVVRDDYAGAFDYGDEKRDINPEQGIIEVDYLVNSNDIYTFTAGDEAGNIIYQTMNIKNIDTESPRLVAKASETAPTKQNVSVTLEMFDDLSTIYKEEGGVTTAEKTGSGGIQYRIEGEDYFRAYQSSNPPVLVTEQNMSKYVIVRDVLGNTATFQVYVNNIDKNAPTINADMAGNVVSAEDLNIGLIYRDDVDETVQTAQYAVTESPAAPGRTDHAWKNFDGTSVVISNPTNDKKSFYLHAYAKDTVGNETSNTFGPYMVYKSAPTITIQSKHIAEHPEDAFRYLKEHDIAVTVDQKNILGIAVQPPSAEPEATTEEEPVMPPEKPAPIVSYVWTEEGQTPQDGDYIKSMDMLKQGEDLFAGNVKGLGISGIQVLHVKVNFEGETDSFYSSAAFRFDNIPPLLLLNGDSKQVIRQNSGFIDYGAKAVDNLDAYPKIIVDWNDFERTEVIEGKEVTRKNQDRPGVYTVKYYAYDEAGNRAVMNRTIEVLEELPVSMTLDEDTSQMLSKVAYQGVTNGNLKQITLLTLPQKGILTCSGSALSVGDLINADDIEQMKYEPEFHNFGDDGFTWGWEDSYDSKGVGETNITIFPINDTPYLTGNEAIELTVNDIDTVSSEINLLDYVDDYDRHNTIPRYIDKLQIKSVNTEGVNGDLKVKGAESEEDAMTLTYQPTGKWQGIIDTTCTITDGVHDLLVNIQIQVIDKTGPDIVVTYPHTDADGKINWTNQDPEITLRVRDVYAGTENPGVGLASVAYKEIGQPDEEYQELQEALLQADSFAFTAQHIGEYTIRAIDVDGNVTYLNDNVVNLDRNKPVFHGESANKEWTNQPVPIVFGNIDAEATDTDAMSDIQDLGVKVKRSATGFVLFNLDNWQTVDNNEQYLVIDNGTYTFKVADKAGNESDEVSIVVGNVDKLAPILTADCNSAWTTGEVPVQVNVADQEATDTDGKSEIKTLTYTTNEAVPQFGSLEWDENGHASFALVKDGSYQVSITATDYAGNQTVVTKEIRLANADPILAVEQTNGSVVEFNKEDQNFKIHAKDIYSGIRSITYETNEQEPQKGNITLDANGDASILLTNEGNYSVSVTVTNQLDKKVMLTKQVRIDKTKPVLDPTSYTIFDTKRNPLTLYQNANVQYGSQDLLIGVNAKDLFPNPTDTDHHVASKIKKILYTQDGGREWKEVVVGKNGRMEFKVTAPFAGVIDFYVEDAAGNQSADTTRMNLVLDTIAPDHVKLTPNISFEEKDPNKLADCNTMLEMTFNEDIQKISNGGDIEITDWRGNVYETIPINSNRIQLKDEGAIGGHTRVTITLNKTLKTFEKYYVVIENNVFQDMGGNSYPDTKATADAGQRIWPLKTKDVSIPTILGFDLVVNETEEYSAVVSEDNNKEYNIAANPRQDGSVDILIIPRMSDPAYKVQATIGEILPMEGVSLNPDIENDGVIVDANNSLHYIIQGKVKSMNLAIQVMDAGGAAINNQEYKLKIARGEVTYEIIDNTKDDQANSAEGNIIPENTKGLIGAVDVSKHLEQNENVRMILKVDYSNIFNSPDFPDLSGGGIGSDVNSNPSDEAEQGNDEADSGNDEADPSNDAADPGSGIAEAADPSEEAGVPSKPESDKTTDDTELSEEELEALEKEKEKEKEKQFNTYISAETNNNVISYPRDMNLIKEVYVGTDTAPNSTEQIKVFQNPITISVSVPSELKGLSNLQMVNLHQRSDGSYKLITYTDLDQNPDTFTFETDRFSIFVLTGYKYTGSGGGTSDVVVPKEDQKPDDGQEIPMNPPEDSRDNPNSGKDIEEEELTEKDSGPIKTLPSDQNPDGKNDTRSDSASKQGNQDQTGNAGQNSQNGQNDLENQNDSNGTNAQDQQQAEEDSDKAEDDLLIADNDVPTNLNVEIYGKNSKLKDSIITNDGTGSAARKGAIAGMFPYEDSQNEGHICLIHWILMLATLMILIVWYGDYQLNYKKLKEKERKNNKK